MPKNITKKKSEPPAPIPVTTEGIKAIGFTDELLGLFGKTMVNVGRDDGQTLIAIACRMSDHDRKALVRILGKVSQ